MQNSCIQVQTSCLPQPFRSHNQKNMKKIFSTFTLHFSMSFLNLCFNSIYSIRKSLSKFLMNISLTKFSRNGHFYICKCIYKIFLVTVTPNFLPALQAVSWHLQSHAIFIPFKVHSSAELKTFQSLSLLCGNMNGISSHAFKKGVYFLKVS